jgi:hypothetical protein
MRRSIPVALATLLLPAAAFADAQGELRAQWQGVWALTRTAMFSECTDHFTDNDVAGEAVSGKAIRFAAGEPVQVDGVDWTMTGLKVRIELREPFRVEWRDGPYTLYEQRRCRVELKFPREARPNAAAASAAIARMLERLAEADIASAPAWNHREVEAYPADYARVRTEHEAWRAAQTNAAVQRKLDQALDDASHVVEWSQGDADYAADFAAGLHERRSEEFSSCESALDASFYVHGSGKASKRGWEDGQRLAWAVHLASALRGCFVTPAL